MKKRLCCFVLFISLMIQFLVPVCFAFEKDAILPVDSVDMEKENSRFSLNMTPKIRLENAVLYGDSNGDGKINSNDIGLMRKFFSQYDYLSATTAVHLSEGADSDGNGIISIVDLVLLLRYLANYNYEIGESSVVLGPKCEHSFVEVESLAPTCASSGYSIRVCSYCMSKKTQSIAPAGHIFDEKWVIDVSPSASTEGEKSHHCLVCDERKDITSIPVVFESPLTYVVNPDRKSYGIVGIGSFTGSELVIPDSIDGITVSSIESGAFRGLADIQTVVLPDSLKNIGDEAFFGTGITEVVVPVGTETIGNRAFSHCADLTSVVISNTVKSVGEDCFASCEKINQISVFSKDLVFTGTSANTIPASAVIVSYPDSACAVFAEKNGNAFVAIESYINTDGLYFTTNYDGTCNISMANPMISGMLVIPETNLYGEKVVAIGSYAFEYCDKIISVTIPETVSAIGEYAFFCCSGLKFAVIPDTVTEVGAYAFYSCRSLRYVSLSNRMQRINNGTFSHCISLEKIQIPDSITEIGDAALSGCIALTSVTVGDNLLSLGLEAFSGCISLKTITLPKSLVNIGDYAFESCAELAEISIPSGTKTIGNYAFINCTALARVNFTDGIKEIGEYAFSGCKGLRSVVLPDSVVGLGHSAFENCTGLQKVLIGKNLVEIGENTFKQCTLLSAVFLGKSVENIGKNAFAYCKSLDTISIPDSVKVIADYAFFNCDHLYTIKTGNSVESIGEYAFSYCKRLKSVELGDNTKVISAYSFAGCEKLETVTIPKGLYTLGDKAFEDCTKLNDIYYGSTRAKWKWLYSKEITTGEQCVCYDPFASVGYYFVHCTDGEIVAFGNDPIK